MKKKMTYARKKRKKTPASPAAPPIYDMITLKTAHIHAYEKKHRRYPP